jgi:hypothetical protein
MAWKQASHAGARFADQEDFAISQAFVDTVYPNGPSMATNKYHYKATRMTQVVDAQTPPRRRLLPRSNST